MSDPKTVAMVEAAKKILERGCPEGENHFMRVEVAPNDTCCKVFCTECGWESVIDREPVEIQEINPAPNRIMVCAQCKSPLFDKPSPELVYRTHVFCDMRCKADFMEKLLEGK